MRQLIGLALAGLALGDKQESHTLSSRDFDLHDGASWIGGHGAPTGVSLRTGNPGQHSRAAMKMVLSVNSTLIGVSFAYRYVTGFGPTGVGPTVSLSVVAGGAKVGGSALYTSPHFTDYSYSHNNSNYSAPVLVTLSGLALAAKGATSQIELEFANYDRNLQFLVPITFNITCSGAAACLEAPPGPAPTPAPLPPLPPTPAPPKSGKVWGNVGPHNIGDSITADGGESGTLQPVVAAAGNPNVIYTGGNNNAASSGVLKSVDGSKHWIKMNHGLTDTRLHGLHIIDQMGEHVVAGTPSGVFETLDGGANWTHITATQSWGVARSFRNGTVNGVKCLFVGTNAGLGNVPLVQSPLALQKWSLIPSPAGSAAWRTNRVSISDFRAGVALKNSVVGGCLWVAGKGVVHVATIVNETAATWDVRTDEPCQSLAMDPNDANHILVNNASNGAHIYETTDAGKSFHGCLNYRGAVMVAIDRTGWFYVGSEGGIWRNAGGCVTGKWEGMFDRRIARRNGVVRDKVPHDFQGINIDFGGHPGGVAFGSDQGMFMKNVSDTNMTTNLRFISGNGDMNNNVIMHPSIAMGEEPYSRYVVSALWDWGPCASWDNGTHWPSWQTPDDGSGLGFFGEGGGCFGVGESKHALCIHHHNVAYSSRGGKNFTRFITPNGGSVGRSEFARKAGSRSVPSGLVYAPMTMQKPAWDAFADKTIECNATEVQGDLGVHTSYSCLSHADIGLEYKWFPGVNVAVWRGGTDKHCILCKKAGDTSSWKMDDTKGDVSYARYQSATLKTIDDYEKWGDDDDDDDEGPHDHNDAYKWKLYEQSQFESNATASEWNAVMPHLAYGGKGQGDVTDLSMNISVKGGGDKYVLKSWNYGANWTWIRMPDFLQGVGDFTADPTNDTLYTVAGSCISRSYDQAETWTGCWSAPGLTGSFRKIVVRDSKTMIAVRNGDVPLRTTDGGKSWQRMASLANLGRYGLDMQYSWSGKTLALSTIVGQMVVWVSKDDGDTWIDESGDYTSMSGGVAQWYANTLYISSLGQGISSKVFDE